MLYFYSEGNRNGAREGGKFPEADSLEHYGDGKRQFCFIEKAIDSAGVSR